MAGPQGVLMQDLRRIDGRPYGFYKDLRGQAYALGPYELRFDHIQGDPFASPSRVRIDIPASRATLPAWSYAGATARRASADFVHRALLRILSVSRGKHGTGKRRYGNNCTTTVWSLSWRKAVFCPAGVERTIDP